MALLRMLTEEKRQILQQHLLTPCMTSWFR